jgi:hypothetical protein
LEVLGGEGAKQGGEGAKQGGEGAKQGGKSLDLESLDCTLI